MATKLRSTTRHIVTCPDGVIRHPVLGFDSRAEAETFAEWGHCCVAVSEHTFETVEVTR